MAFLGGILTALALMSVGVLPVAHPEDEPSPAPKVVIEIRDGYRYITANGLPNHETGQFPGRGNPNSIKAQSYTFRVTMTPKASDKPVVLQQDRGGPPILTGVAVNGVVFDPGTAEFWRNDRNSGWHITAIGPGPDLGIDESRAHVQPNGAYHYHAVPNGLVEKLAGQDAGKTMVLIGWAADGFPIYARWGFDNGTDRKSAVRVLRPSYRLKAGDRPNGGPQGKYDGTYEQDYEFAAGSGDLDECNGRTGVTPEFPDGTYYYVATDDYPNLPRLLRGMPDPSFQKSRPERGRPSGARGDRGREQRGPGESRVPPPSDVAPKPEPK